MRSRPNEPPLPDALAYFLTWPTYGTWLPGDERGWMERQTGWHAGDSVLESEARARMSETACVLDPEQRRLVEETIGSHCRVRGWHLHAVNCRSNHVHIVVTAPIAPNGVMRQFKAWCSRRLREREARRVGPTQHAIIRAEWWGERGSRRWINDADSLEAAIRYVRDAQDRY
jgi:REP element-mobilizing transposase RayT